MSDTRVLQIDERTRGLPIQENKHMPADYDNLVAYLGGVLHEADPAKKVRLELSANDLKKVVQALVLLSVIKAAAS